jgi:hypothetical protein
LFTDYAGVVAAAAGYDFRFVKVSALFVGVECLATADGFFCSLVPLMCSEILVEM